MVLQAALQCLGSYAQAALDHIHIMHMGPWATLASLSFFTAALMGGDVLALRGALLMAYIFNLLNGLTGVPTWPYIDWRGRLNVDMVLWAVAAGCLHGCSVLRMLMDEMPVKFPNVDDEQLARFFNRRGGMERLEAREVVQRGCWIKVGAGQQIADSVQIHERVFLVVEGRCRLLRYRSTDAQTPPAAAAAAPATQQPYQQPTAVYQHPPQHPPQHPLRPCLTSSSTADHFIPTADSAVKSFALWDASSDDEGSSPPVSDDFWITSDQQKNSNNDNNSSYVVSVMPTTAPVTPPKPPQAAGGYNASTAAYESPTPGSSTAARSSTTTPSPTLPVAWYPQHIPVSATSNMMSSQPQFGVHMLSSPGSSRVLVDQRVKLSGDVFSMAALNVFGVYIGFDHDRSSQLEVWAETDCLLFSWPLSAMEDMATRCSPSLASYWRNFITYSLANEFEQLAHRHIARHRCSTGESEPAEYRFGARSRDFTDPLRHHEQPERFSWYKLRTWLRRAVSPFPPRGLRHTALPTSGVMARNRVLAVATEQACAKAAREEAVKASSGSSLMRRDVWYATPEDASLRQALLDKLPLM